MLSESDVQQYIQAQGPYHNCLLFRNNSGALQDKTGRLVRYGLGNVSAILNKTMKSSDLIGITTVVVTQDMVGKTVGIFTAIEVKAESWRPGKDKKREEAQANFINLVKLKGGISAFCRSVSEFTTLFS